MSDIKQQTKPEKATANAAWITRAERGSMLLLKLMAWISLTAGRRISRIALYPITGYFILFSPSVRQSSRAYLQRVLDGDIRWIHIYRHILAFSSIIHDRVYLLKDHHNLFHVEVFNEELILNAARRESGAFILGAHLGSFEVIRFMGRQHREIHTAMVMYKENAQKINALLTAINPQFHQEIIPLGCVDTMLKVYESLNSGKVLCMLADRTLGGEDTISMPFLGKPAAFPTGPFRMAMLMKRPVYFMAGLYLGDNRYSIHFEKLIDFSHTPAIERENAIIEAISRYAGLLENFCRQAPYNWFNFFDFWQLSPPAPRN